MQSSALPLLVRLLRINRVYVLNVYMRTIVLTQQAKPKATAARATAAKKAVHVDVCI